MVNDLNQTFPVQLGGEYHVDFPSVDIFSTSLWGDFLEEWRLSSFQLGDTLSQFVKQVALGVANHFGTPIIQMDLDPLDDKSPLDLLSDAFDTILEQDWFISVIEGAEERVGLVDCMSDGLCAFIESRGPAIFGMEG